MSRLSAALRDYLAIRRALGFQLKLAEWVLTRFVAYADQVGAETVTTDLAVAWATQPVGASPVWWKFRLTAVRGFAKHLHTLDPLTQIPPADAVSAPRCRAAPYFYSEAEIVRLMEEAATLLPPFRGVTYQTLIGLLAVTGMRLGEAIRLERADVDWEHGILTIRLSKFGKSRQIPVDPSTLSALRTYDQAHDRLGAGFQATAQLFVSIRGTPLREPNVDRTFHHLAGKAGLRPRSPRCRPRVHDLRHSFAIRTLLGWYRAGLDVQAMLPRLSTYLGHTNPANTYWYLSAEPELLALAGQRLERAWEVAP
ncbi:MAG: tyrosine-type recombinase/integrase [Betaproteobacteria bacterium]|nr:tyrosine-type recombinase/integrase [Betaproteobacteria bacterium]